MTDNLLSVGDEAPAFDLPTSDDCSMSLSQFRGKQGVVLYFYPKDDTPGCTQEACDLRDQWSQFQKLNVAVLGVSMDTVLSHKKFVDKFTLPFPLLYDEAGGVSKRYGVYKEKSLYGRKFWGIERTTFIIGKEGIIQRIFPKVKVAGHVAQIMAEITGW